jgi:hypothetical protein
MTRVTMTSTNLLYELLGFALAFHMRNLSDEAAAPILKLAYRLVSRRYSMELSLS